MEKRIQSISGLIVIMIQLLITIYVANHVYQNWSGNVLSLSIESGLTSLLFIVLANGFVVIEPNDARTVSFMGKYKGTLKENGFVFINPFYSTRRWSLKVSNYQTSILKVNEKNGAPIEISATITWKINDTYKAQYDIEDVDNYIRNQFNVSLRKFAQNHTYNELLSEGLEFIEDLKEKVSRAGVEILDAKITHLNYAAEIAGSMLQKQQAKSLNEAKEIIVHTAVDIAKEAAKRMGDLNPEQKAKFTADLIIVLCSDKSISPVLNISQS